MDVYGVVCSANPNETKPIIDLMSLCIMRIGRGCNRMYMALLNGTLYQALMGLSEWHAIPGAWVLPIL